METRNVLVRVTLPKRTGRKRKRGSDEPFTGPIQTETHPTSITAPELLQRLRDNEHRFTAMPVAVVRDTHRFRSLPDFQMRNADLPIMRKLRDHAMAPDYEKFKGFNLNFATGVPDLTQIPAAPTFTCIDMPYKYEYQQAATVVFYEDDTGQMTTKNLAKPTSRLTWGLDPDAKDVPQAAPFEIPKRNPSGEMLPRAIQHLQELLEDRPLVTKRVAVNSMPQMSDTIFKEACQYVGYSFKAGPWRDSLIRYGVDPRSDPKFRFYQTLMFQIDNLAFKSDTNTLRSEAGNGMQSSPPKTKSSGSQHSKSRWARSARHTREENDSHIFDGKTATANGKTWQICDVTDPIVYALFHTDNIRSECDVYQWGWYQSGTIGKARVIMKDKMRCIFAGETPPEKDYEALAALPDELTAENMSLAVLERKKYGEHASLLSMDVRNIVKGGEGTRSAKTRWSQRKERQRSGYEGSAKDWTPEDDEEMDVELREIDDGSEGGAGDLDEDRPGAVQEEQPDDDEQRIDGSPFPGS